MANQWQIRQGQKIHGPFTDAQLRHLYREGRIIASTPVRDGDNGVWQKAGSLGFSTDFDGLSAPKAPPKISSPPRETHPSQSPKSQPAAVENGIPAFEPFDESWTSKSTTPERSARRIRPRDVPEYLPLLISGIVFLIVSAVLWSVWVYVFVEAIIRRSRSGGDHVDKALRDLAAFVDTGFLMSLGAAVLITSSIAIFLLAVRTGLRELRRIVLLNELVLHQLEEQK